MTKEEKLQIIDDGISSVKELIELDVAVFLCNHTRVCEIPEIEAWINNYQAFNGSLAFHHNLFDGKPIEVTDSQQSYSKEKLIMLLEIRRRIENDEPLTIHESIFQ